MANIRKSFNFRTGLQVDNDNFVVNANGLVGIGTSIPQNYLLNVYGDTRVTGLTTTGTLRAGVGTVGVLSATNADVSGILSVAQIKVGSSNVISNLIGYGYTAWITNDGGVGLHTLSRVGIGTTTTPTEQLKVFGDVAITTSLTVGSATTLASYGINTPSGIVTASKFVGVGSDLTNLDASNVALGTLSNSRLPSNISVSGIVTATTFVGSFTGTATTATNLSSAANITAGTISDDRLPDLITSNINVSSGVSTVSSIDVGTGGTAFTALSSGRIGVGTAIPTSELQIRKSSGSLAEVVSDSGQARISVGNSVGAGNSSAVLRFGNVDKTLDLVNNDTGNLNFILHGGSAGVDTGRFDWLYGQNIVSPLMSLTYEGDFGIGETNPSNTLHVVGTSTVTSTAYFGGDVRAKKIYFTELVDGVVKTNANINSGISTFNKVYLTGGDNVLSINSDAPTGTNKFYIANSTDAYLGNQASMGSPVTADATYFASNLGADAAQLKVYGNSYVGSDLYVRGNLYATSQLASGLTGSPSITVTNVNASGIVTATNGFTSGIGSAVVISVVGNTLTFTVGTATTSLTLS